MARNVESSLCLCLTVLFALAVSAARSADDTGSEAKEPLREWSDTTGTFQIDATFVSYDDGQVKLRRFDGKVIEVDISRLSRKDRDYVRKAVVKTKSATSKPSPTPDSTTPAKPPSKKVGPPDPNCPVCHGLGIAPREKLPVYIHVERSRPPKPSLSLGCRFCPECQAGKDNRLLEDQEAERLKTAGERHREWENRLQVSLVRVENHALVVHAQLSVAEARRVAEALEALTAHLQQQTGSMLLSNRRPATDDMIILANPRTYERLIDYFEENEKHISTNWDLMRRVAGASIRRVSFFRRSEFGTPMEDIAVHISATNQMQIATHYKSPDWLNQGFGAYCEFAVLRKNLMHGLSAQSIGMLRMDGNWDVQLRRIAAAGGLLSWEEMFKTELAVYKPVHYFQSKSMVTFLMRNPDRFLKMVELFSGGAKAAEALADAYDTSVEELEKDYRRWMGVR